MYGYKMKKPRTLPKIVWACKTKVEQYDWRNKNKKNWIEFSICKAEKRTVVMLDRAPETVEGESFSCLFEDEACRSYAEDSVSVEILTVAVSFDDLSYTRKEWTAEDMEDGEVLLLPRMQKDLSEQMRTRLENLFYQIIESYKEPSASAEMMCAATVLRMMAELDRVARQGFRNRKDKFTHYYVEKAESILRKRFDQRITVKDVARELSVSPNYLSAIFKASFGIGMTARLLELRMKKAAVLLTEQGRSESEAASLVGYEDVGHFRKRFKQYFGVSIRDYCCITKELTLYHDKPRKRMEEK